MRRILLLFVFISLNSFAQCWQSLSVGEEHSVGIKTDGSLWAWGANFFGQIGDGTVTMRKSPLRIGTLKDWKIVSAGGG
ncbi:hypothetical protein, partial [Chryseobacterium artocarpi]